MQNPYATMTKEQIKAELDGKSLNQILDAAAQNAVPGQVGFFKQVVSTYFTSLDASDKRSCSASALRYAKVFDFTGVQGADALQSAKQAAVNKFAGTVLKGAGPLLHKMMQGLPKDVMGAYADALEDMKQHLAPIPRKIVQAYLNQMIAESDDKIKSITLEKSLGAASVGEAFLCEFEVRELVPRTHEVSLDEMLNNGGQQFVPDLDDEGNPIMEEQIVTRRAVVKIMRHDAERRVRKEAEIFTAAAGKIPGMAKTWQGQYEQYRKEFDFRTEARNVQTGQTLYGIKDNDGHSLQAIAPHVTSMQLSNLAPTKKNIMVAEVMDGDTLDSYFKTAIGEIRHAASAVFEQDPGTGRVKWEEKIDPLAQQPVKKPVLRRDIPATAVSTLQVWLSTNRRNLTKVSGKLQEATKAWFYNALVGDGKFHGDPHAGNLMVDPHQVGFIDFVNLYQLDRNRADGVNEQQQLLRVILGAAFRDKKFILDGFDKLMSAEGKARLADPVVRAKAEAILDSVLDASRGNFSFNIVYRLQAAIVELQKLGLELPLQINCFIQSLVRLSNTITEINTIVNQADALLRTAANLDIPAPPDRDELDYIGRIADAHASAAGRTRVLSRTLEDGSLVPVPEGVPPQPGDVLRPRCQILLQSREFGGNDKGTTDVFKPGNAYSNKVVARLAGVQDPVVEAGKLVDTFERQSDAGHNAFGAAYTRDLRKALDKLCTDLAAAGGDDAAKTTAFRAFADIFARVEGKMVEFMDRNIRMAGTVQALDPPDSFASAITDILFDNFQVLRRNLGADGFAMYNDAHSIVDNELHVKVGYFNGDGVIDAIKEDARRVGGDKDYAIDIGV